MSRDYLAEASALPVHKFDEIMHAYLWRSFDPHFQGVSALELGCFRGAFTRRIRAEFPDVTVIDASAECIKAVKDIGQFIECVHSTFEDAQLDRKYDAIFAVHCLEHLDDPVAVLKRCREWLAPEGKLFVAVPNAYALSRQLAVKMGLVEDEKAVTKAEREHGHKRTYCNVELTMHLSDAGLTPIKEGGVMLKPMSNWQWDKALAEGIVDAAYLEACYELGKRHPTMCASLYAVCVGMP